MRNKKNAVIALKSVGFTYDNVNWILKGISLDVGKSERVVILGHNGSGKTTLVKLLGALLTPSQGACFICGQDSSDSASLAEIHKKVSLVFQNPESQIVGAVVEDDVAFAPENQGLAPSEIEERVTWGLSKTGLLDKRAVSVSALSGGEKQRLALAGALAADAVCLILDEPTAMLDPEGRLEVEAALRDIHASGTTIVQVTHRLEDAYDADRVLVLSGGEWLWQGEREEFWDRAEDLGFELPPLLRLERRLRSRSIPVPSRSIEGIARAVLDADCFPKKSLDKKKIQDEKRRVDDGPVPLIEIRSLSYRFNEGTPVETEVLKEISCAVPRGAWLSVLGRTGSGKSTLIQHLNGLYGIQRGEILIEGEPLPQAGECLRTLRRRVGLVFQSPEDQLFSPSVREEISFAPRNWDFSEEAAAASAARAAASVGLDDRYLDRNPLRLSGGERRLVAIASVLAADPECVVLDEPTAGLDAGYRKRILSLLAQLRAQGKTVVTVTHDLEMAFEYSDRLLVIDGGQRIYEGGVRDALSVLWETQGRQMLPDVLRLSGMLREGGLHVPLTWDPEILSRAFHFDPA